MIDQAAQAQMVRLAERFHRDVDGTGPTGDVRFPMSVFPMPLESRGPLPQRRTAFLSPGVSWQSVVTGPTVEDLGAGPERFRSVWLSIGEPVSYDAGSRHTLTWMRRPLGPSVGGEPQGFFCALPLVRNADSLEGVLVTQQGSPGQSGCVYPVEGQLTLSRDGVVLGTTSDHWFDLPMPAQSGTYQLTYEQRLQAPYLLDSATTWTFRSAPPADVVAEQIPLLVLDYLFPLDTLNRPTGDTATVTVDQVEGVTERPIRQLRVWTSIDHGGTWRSATVIPVTGGRYRVELPEVPVGSRVSLRTEAGDTGGNQIEQTLYDAYTGV